MRLIKKKKEKKEESTHTHICKYIHTPIIEIEKGNIISYSADIKEKMNDNCSEEDFNTL